MSVTSVNVLNRDELNTLNAQLLQGDLVTRADAAETLANMASQVDTEWRVTVYDNLWRPVQPVGDDMIDLVGTDPRNNLPSATLKVQGSSTLIDRFMGCRTTMVGVTVETAGLRFPFYVDTFDYEFKDDAWVGTANLKGIWDILNFYQIWPDWFLPIQAQLFSYAVFVGALCTCIETMVATTALRLQSGINEFLNNALSLNPDISAWYGTLLQDNGNIASMLQTPTYVVRTDPNLDTSPLLAKTVRMESCGSVITNITRPYGVDCRMDLWLPGDDQPDQWTRTIPSMALTQPTYVFSTKDRSQITGPTRTVADSVIRTVVDLEGSLLGNVLDPLLNPKGIDEGALSPLPQGMFIAPTLGVNFVAPWAVLIAPEPGKKGSVETCKITDHTPKGWQHIIGGRSPKWLVCAPPGNRGGTHPMRDNTIKRFNECDLLVDHRLHLDFDRIHRYPKQSARRILKQHFPGLPAHRILQPQSSCRPIPSRDRSFPRHLIFAIRHRNLVRVH
jgi:hypothetical protein